jgi:hypothetical protein
MGRRVAYGDGKEAVLERRKVLLLGALRWHGWYLMAHEDSYKQLLRDLEAFLEQVMQRS